MSREDNTNEHQTMGQPIFNVGFQKADGSRIYCQVPSDSSIENMIQIYKNKTSIDLNHYVFMFNGEKIDINSQIKINEFFNGWGCPTILAIDF